MPTINYTRTLITTAATLVEWTNLANGDDGQWYQTGAGWAERSIDPTGDFGGGTLTIQGTNELLTPAASPPTLNDPQGNPLTFVSRRLETILETSAQIRPILAGGAAGAVTVRMLIMGRPQS